MRHRSQGFHVTVTTACILASALSLAACGGAKTTTVTATTTTAGASAAAPAAMASLAAPPVADAAAMSAPAGMSAPSAMPAPSAMSAPAGMSAPAASGVPAPAASAALPPGMGPDPQRAKELLAGAYKVLPSGVKQLDLAPGEGPVVEKGMTATFNYTGYLVDGTKFDSSASRGGPVPMVNVGNASAAVPYLQAALLGMKKGGKRRILVPRSMTMSPHGGAPKDVVFDLELVSMAPAPAAMVFPDIKKTKLKTSESGLQWADLAPGVGTEVKEKSDVMVHYTGWLADGTKFDSSLDHGMPLPVEGVPHAGVIAGWNEGLMGMKEGGRRLLVIPPALGYGPQGQPPVIPANATLVFIVEVVNVRSR